MSRKHGAAKPAEQEQADAIIGQRIKHRRVELGLTQQALADRIGVAYQQVQRYENGTNRTSSFLLAQIAEGLDKPVEYFLPKRGNGHLPKRPDRVVEFATSKQGRRLVEAVLSIKTPRLRAKVLGVARELAKLHKA